MILSSQKSAKFTDVKQQHYFRQKTRLLRSPTQLAQWNNYRLFSDTPYLKNPYDVCDKSSKNHITLILDLKSTPVKANAIKLTINNFLNTG